jgi:hypothetical protein
MSKEDVEAFLDTTPIAKAQHSGTFAIIATRGLAITLGLVFWTLLLLRIITLVIVRAIHLG